ncbi:MAG: 2-phospho-L-lactate guanylyltransferase [Actinomycetota bacterium]|nr:2-phospho-L-lactate guanylyltransferase [Actinomycetota bacterium]
MLGWSVVVPVKRLELAKTRLRPAVPAAGHDRLVLAICLDTVTAALRCPDVARVVAVTSDPVAAPALRTAGALVVPDEPDRGLNPALEHGAETAAQVAAGDPVATLSADLPALRPAELGEVLAAAAGWRRSFVCDAAGSGTTLLAVQAGQPLAAAYGPASRAAHLASGAVELRGDWPTVRCDVDTPADLQAAGALGLGSRTSALLAAVAATPYTAH